MHRTHTAARADEVSAARVAGEEQEPARRTMFMFIFIINASSSAYHRASMHGKCEQEASAPIGVAARDVEPGPARSDTVRMHMHT